MSVSKTEVVECMRAERAILQSPYGRTVPPEALREAALAYAKSCGWLDPKQAAELEKGAAEVQAVAEQKDRELAAMRAKVFEMLVEIERLARML